MVLALISLSIAHPYAHATSGPINNRSVNSITWLPLIDQSSYLERLKESICQHCHLTLSHKQMHQTRRNKNQNVCCSFRNAAAAAAAKSLPSCLTLCDPIDGSPYYAAIKRMEIWTNLGSSSRLIAEWKPSYRVLFTVVTCIYGDAINSLLCTHVPFLQQEVESLPDLTLNLG